WSPPSARVARGEWRKGRSAGSLRPPPAGDRGGLALQQGLRPPSPGRALWGTDDRAVPRGTAPRGCPGQPPVGRCLAVLGTDGPFCKNRHHLSGQAFTQRGRKDDQGAQRLSRWEVVQSSLTRTT